jgi:polyphosphate kinase 2 (PPK2 family)
VLVVRVHKDILEREAIPDPPRRDKKIWRERYRSIDDFVRHLGVNGTRVVKIFLHRSKDEQRKRSLDRIDNAEKNWKFSNADSKEREFWDDYARAYAECLGETSTSDAPWYVAPGDDKENARLIVSQILVDTLEALDISYPKTSAGREAELPAFRKALVK